KCAKDCATGVVCCAYPRNCTKSPLKRGAQLLTVAEVVAVSAGASKAGGEIGGRHRHNDAPEPGFRRGVTRRYKPYPSGSRNQKRLSARRPQSVGAAVEVALGKIGRGYMSDGREACVPCHRQHLRRSEEAEEGCPRRSRVFLDFLVLLPLLAFGELRRQKKRHRQCRASGERREAAQCGRDCIPRQVHRDAGACDHRWPTRIEARGREPVPPVIACLEVDRRQSQPVGNAEAKIDQALALPRLRLRPALREGVESGAEYEVLCDAERGLFGDKVIDEASAGNYSCPEPARAVG